MNWLDKHQLKIFWFSWFCIILFCVFIFFSYTVKASSPDSLPYYVNQHVPFEVPFTFEDVVEGAFNNPNYNITGVTGLTKEDVLNCENYLLICNYYSSPRYMTFSYHILIENNYSISLSNNNYDTFVAGADTVNLTFNGYNQNLGKYITLGVLYNAEVYTWQNSGFGYNNFSTVKVFDSNNNYPLQYPFAIKQDFVIGNDNLVVLGNFTEPIISTGHATPPINDQGHFIPNVNPQQPTIIPFQPTTPQFPSINTSTLETLVESLIDIVKYGFNWLGGVISGVFSNLLSNISNLFDFVVDSFNLGFNNIVGSIQDFASDFYNNMVSLFEPFMSNISYLLEPLNIEEIQSTFEGTNFYGIFSDYSSFFNTFDTVFTETSEPDSLIIPIHLENISTLAEFGVTCQYLDLTQFEEIRSPLRAFCWVFCSFGAIMLVTHSLPDWLKGSSGGGSSSVSGKE